MRLFSTTPAAGLIPLSIAFLLLLPPPAALAQASACSGDPRFRALDFLIGDWEARTPSGKLVGTNLIEAVAGGCAIVERWHGAAGGRGFGLHWLDAESGLWREIWIDGEGNSVEESGQPEAAGIMYTGVDRRGGKDVRIGQRFLKAPNGGIRQIGERATGPDAPLVTEWELIYTGRRP